MAIVLAHYLDALGPFLKYFPDAVASVINKLFELLTSLPIAIKVLIDLYIVCVKGHAWIIVTHVFLVGSFYKSEVTDLYIFYSYSKSC